jgi:predicted DNA-binding transcriptional regulator AlpA
VKLLEIQSSPRGECSDSITLTKSFIEACKSYNTSIVVDTLNVWHERLPEFDYDAIGAKYKGVRHEAMTEAESNVWERIQSLMQRFLELATRLGVPVKTLAEWASKGTGPRYAKFGKHVRYRLSDVIAWENDQFAA